MQKATTKNDVGIVGTLDRDRADALGRPSRVALPPDARAAASRRYLDSGRNPVVGQWQHLAATFDGTTARFYVDGVEVASRAFSGSVGTSNTWRIGAYGGGPGGFFDGVIDEVRVYDRALGAAEILADRDQPLGLAEPGRADHAGEPRRHRRRTGDVDLARLDARRPTTRASPATPSTSTARRRARPPGRASPSPTSPARAATSSRWRRSTGTATRRHAPPSSGSTTPCEAAPGLVAAYAFEEGSGPLAYDASGNWRNGTITGATWAAGRNGSGLSLDGVDDHVSLGSLGTFYTAGFTLEAWVRKSTAKKDVAVVGSWAGNGPMLWVDHLAGRHYLTLGDSFSTYLDSGVSPARRRRGSTSRPPPTGSTARYYVDGVEVASRAVSGPVGSSNTWRIGAYGGAPGGFLDGVVDDVRIYNRALSAGEIQFDRDHGVVALPVPPDTHPAERARAR